MSTATRINQYVAAASSLSRRAADAAVAAGRVQIGDHTATPGETVTAGTTVKLDGHVLKPPQIHHYVILHKPVGYISSRAQQGKDPTLYDLLPKNMRNLRIAGRLDRDSSGLVLLSDDGPFINRYTHPSHGKIKVYELELNKPLTATDRSRLETGVRLADGLSRLGILAQRGRHATVSLSEGRNRQIRRTLGALGYDVVVLHRTAIGNYRLGELKSGSWQEVTAQ